MNAPNCFLVILALACLAAVAAQPVSKSRGNVSTSIAVVENSNPGVFESIFITPCRMGFMYNHKGDCKKVKSTF